MHGILTHNPVRKPALVSRDVSSTYKAPLNKGGWGDPQKVMLPQETDSGHWMVGIPPQPPLIKGGGKIGKGVESVEL